MVAVIHPITHPGKTKTKVCLVLLLATAATTASMTDQTTAQPMLYVAPAPIHGDRRRAGRSQPPARFVDGIRNYREREAQIVD
jgi:predicted ribosomally synthesized peptide with SipW-like signal peptide